MRTKWLACLAVLAGCPDVSKDSNEGAPVPTAEFDPANSIVPFPNNLVIDPATHRVSLPAQPCESDVAKATREQTLNKLDGFGTYEVAMTTTLTEPPDPTTLSANVIMYKIATGTTPVDPQGAQPVPVVVQPTKTLRFDPASCTTPAMIDTIAVVPQVPLEQHATYVVAVKSGLAPMAGGTFFPSAIWSFVRQTEPPVTLDANGNVVSERTPLDPTDPTDANGNGIPDAIEQLRGIAQLWQVHAPALQFLDKTGAISSRGDVLVAWTFTTQTTTDPLDPQVAMSPAAMAPTGKLGTFISLNQQVGLTAPQFLAAVLPAGTCNALPCNAVGEVFGGALVSPSYQQLGPNPLSGGNMIPGAWDDPYQPTVQNMDQGVQFLATIPAGGTPPYPLVVFGHGLGSSKDTMLAIAPQLAAAGFATIAIDFQAHGSRAIRASIDPAIGCAGHCSVTTGTACTATSDCPTGETCKNGAGTTISPTTTQLCYAPFLSPDLATTRDNIRQTVLDLERLVLAAKACGASGCTAAVPPNSAFPIDPNHIVYMGISLGGIIGSTTSAVVPFQGSVLNVSAMGWVDILENTQTLGIKCPLVNALIDLGIVMGTKWDPANPTVGTCTTSDWLMQPGYRQFAATARWVFDPADGANFATKLAPRKFVLQEVVDDKTVPNIATDRQGALLGLMPMMADPYAPPSSPPSAAITTNLTQSKWVRYKDLPATDAATGNFGNAFQHASLLSPAAAPGHCVGNTAMVCGSSADCSGAGGVCVFPGVLGTARVQVDAITFLVGNH
jgi:hypothetical protein